MRVRSAAILPMEDGLALIHRTNNKITGMTDYYTFPGGGVEAEETLEQTIIREIKEELGVDIEVIEKLYELDNKEIGQMEYFFLCKYISGKLGTGDGPEFSGDPKYSNRGNYIPKIVERENIENINLLPSQIKAKLVEDIKKGRF